MAAHAVKGAIATIGSPAGRDRAAQIEAMARSNNWIEAERAYGELRSLIRRLDEALEEAGLVRRPPQRRPRATRVTRRKRSRP